MDRVDLRTNPSALGAGFSRLRRARLALAKRFSPPLGAALLLSACTIVQVGDGAGIRTSYYPGLAVIHVTPADSAQVVEVKSLGASSVANSATLGWSHSRIALVPPGRCQLILWRPRTPELTGLRGLLGPQGEVCELEGEGQ